MESDSIIAQNIVRKLFTHINLCLQTDRSKVKLNMMEKGIIKGMLSEKTLSGLNRYIANMNSSDLQNLIDDIQVEINKRDHKAIISSDFSLNTNNTSTHDYFKKLRNI